MKVYSAFQKAQLTTVVCAISLAVGWMIAFI